MAENGVSIYSILQNPIKDPNDSQVPTHTGAPNPMTPRPAPSGAPNLRTSKNDPSLSPAFFSPAFFSPASFSPASFSPAFFSPAFFSHSPVLRSCPPRWEVCRDDGSGRCVRCQGGVCQDRSRRLVLGGELLHASPLSSMHMLRLVLGGELPHAQSSEQRCEGGGSCEASPMQVLLNS